MLKDRGHTLKGAKRWVWLSHFINKRNYTIGAEIGVHKGNTTSKLMASCPALHLIVVDKWENITPDPNGEKIGCEKDDMELIKSIFDDRMKSYRRRLTILRGDSSQMADNVKDNSLDFIFIDADHRYEPVKRDIAAWVPKLKPGGLLSGHDISLPGVQKAVEELVPTYRKTNVDDIWAAKKEDYVG